MHSTIQASSARRRTRNPKSRDRRDAPATTTLRLDDPDTFPRIYASTCVGGCMEPELTDGCTLVFDKEAEMHGGDYVAIWIKPEFLKPGEEGRMVKRLAVGLMPGLTFPYEPIGGNVKPAIIVEMLNPPRTFRVPVEKVRAMHRCIGEAAPTTEGLARMVARFADGGERIPIEPNAA